VLGINRLTGPPVTLELYRIGTQLPSILGGVTRKVAFVVLGDRESVRGGLFVENVTMNRGIYSRVFEDEARALAWLLEEA